MFSIFRRLLQIPGVFNSGIVVIGMSQICRNAFLKLFKTIDSIHESALNCPVQVVFKTAVRKAIVYYLNVTFYCFSKHLNKSKVFVSKYSMVLISFIGICFIVHFICLFYVGSFILYVKDADHWLLYVCREFVKLSH